VGVAVAGGDGQTGFSAGGQMSGSGARAVSRGGSEAQPARNASAAARAKEAMDDNGCTELRREKEVAWVFLEILAALAIAIGIVWWTLPKKPKPGAQDRAQDREE
jgi:hypothetical protein